MVAIRDVKFAEDGLKQKIIKLQFINVNHSALKDGAFAKGVNPLARPIDKGSYMVLESLFFRYFDISV